MALAVDDHIKIVDLRPPDEIELGFREFMARFDAPWHRDAAMAFERQEQWYGAAIHWGQLVEHDPSDTQAWQKLEASCDLLGNWELGLTTCNWLLQREGMLGAVYMRRAR